MQTCTPIHQCFTIHDESDTDTVSEFAIDFEDHRVFLTPLFPQFAGSKKCFLGVCFEESFGVGDHMQCHMSRNAQGLSISYSKNGVALGTAFQLQARCKGLRLSIDCIVVVYNS